MTARGEVNVVDSVRCRVAGLAGAALWMGAFTARFMATPQGWWRWRDDAVITLAHARGWVVDGSISVSTTGARVDGFSTPLQFMLATIYYRLGLTRYELFLDLQVVVSLLCAGYFAVRVAQFAGWRGPAWPSVVIAGTTAVLVVVPWASAGWMVSGMEESLAVAATLAGAAGLVRLAHGEGRFGGSLYAGSALAVLGLARVEFALLMLPVVALAVAVSVRRSRVQAGVAAGIPLGVWVVVHLSRLWYFGSLSPNTVLAEDRNPGAVVRSWIPSAAVFVGFVVVLGGTLLAIRWLWITRVSQAAPDNQVAPADQGDQRDQGVSPGWIPNVNNPRVWAVSLVVAAAGFVALRTVVDAGLIRMPLTWPVVRDSFSALGLVALLLVLFAGLLVSRSPVGITEGVLALLALLPMAQLTIAGGARLDPMRVAGLAIPPLALLVVLLAASSLQRARHLRLATFDGALAGVALVAVLSGAVWFGTHPEIAQSGNLCCSITPLDEVIAAKSIEHRDATRLPSVIVANPDLGKLSHRREFEIIDLGLIGDPLLTRLTRDAPELRDRYLLDIAAPDVVEIHPGFTCQFATWTSSAPFRARYLQVDKIAVNDVLDPTCPQPIEWVVYARTLNDPGYRTEVDLAIRLAGTPDAAALVRSSLEVCRSAPGDALRCEHVRRAATRNRPRLQVTGQWDDVVTVFKDSPAAGLDRALLGAAATPAWQNAAFAALTELAARGDIQT